MVAHVGKDQEFWVQLMHGGFGIGGIFGPIGVRILERKAFALFGVLMLSLIPAFIMKKSPE